MIKKILLGLGITFLSFIGFSSALTLSSTYQNGSYIEGQDNIQLAVYNRGMLGSNRLGNIKRMLGFGSYVGGSIIQRKYFWWNDGKAYFYWYFKATKTQKVAGVFTKYSLCNEIHNSSTGSIELFGCVSDDWGDGSFASGFFNSITANDYWGFQNTSNGNRSFNLCFSSSSYAKSICFISDTNITNNFSEIEMENNIDYVSFPNSLLGDPPGRSTSGGGNGGDNGGGSSSVTVGITPGTIDASLNYYENYYGWDSSICYAGVNSLSYLYGQNGVSYEKGSGLSIFDIYYQLYGTGDSKEDMLLYSSRWLNSWLINYHERFDTSGDPSWLAYYNSGTHLVDYQFDNLGFPFANQPVAFYFLTDNIQGQTEQITQGEEVVSYCNIKINSGTYDEIIGSANKYNINSYTEQGNTNVGLNPDGTKHEYTGAFLGSGVNLAFSGNVSIKNTLKNFFDKLNNSISINSVPGVIAILPDWLVVGFLTIMLFKFFRKKS